MTYDTSDVYGGAEFLKLLGATRQRPQADRRRGRWLRPRAAVRSSMRAIAAGLKSPFPRPSRMPPDRCRQPGPAPRQVGRGTPHSRRRIL